MEIILERLDDVDPNRFVIETPEIAQTQPEFLIGRATDCKVRIASEFVSRHHCGLVVDEDEGAVRVRDLGSRNGTFVNDEVVRGDCDLKDGDKLIVGYIPFEIHINEQAGQRS
jgi:predicted component of type VI protein secretion system